MLRLFVVSLAVAVCQCELCDPESWLSCQCYNDGRELLFSTSHNELENGEWYTTVLENQRNSSKDLRCQQKILSAVNSTTYLILPFGGSCDTDSALDLWNNVTDNGRCRPTSPIPPRGERPTESEMIDKGYERQGSSLYKFHNVTQDWENARRICESEGAHLAIVNAEEEAKILVNIFARYPSLVNAMHSGFALVGFHDHFTEGNYLTIFGEPIETTGFSEWAPLNPDNSGRNYAGHPGEDCGSVNRKGKFNDVPCWGKYAFFCELEDEDYPPISNISYIAGYYTGVESVIKPPPGKENRQMPSSGYTLYPGVGFYKMHTESETWENARRICESEDAHLAIINSEIESAVLSVVFSKHKKIYDALWNDFAFIGFHDQYTEGEFLTIYNETLKSTGFTNWWASFEPNNLGASKVDVGEDCGAVHRNGGLNDLPCNKRHAFICEQPLLV